MSYTVLMRSKIVLPLFLFAVYDAAYAQDSPFGRPGLELGILYRCNVIDQCGDNNYSLKYLHDTVVCGQKYHFYRRIGSPYYIRYDAGQVFFRRGANPCNFDERRLYDFSLQPGETFVNEWAGPPALEVDSIGMFALLNGAERRYLRLHIPGSSYGEVFHWVEGIGDLDYGFTRESDFEGGFEFLACARDSTGLLYINEDYDYDCDSLLCPVPYPRFAFEPEGLQVVFSDGSANAESWHWDFGDGQVSQQRSPVHEYSAPGCYEVCLTVATSCLPQEYQYCHAVNVEEGRWWRKLDFSETSAFRSAAFVNAETGWVITASAIWHTQDGGESWSRQDFPPDAPNARRLLSQIHFANQQVGVIIAGNQHYSGGVDPAESNILWTANGGQDWLDKNQGDGSYLLNGAISSPQVAWASGQYTGILKTTDGGDSWQETPIEGYYQVEQFFAISEDTVYILGKTGNIVNPSNYENVFVRTSDGANWEIIPLGRRSLRDMYFLDSRRGFIAGGYGQLIQTTDGGNTWADIGLDSSYALGDVVFVSADTGWLAAQKGIILHTRDGGQSWERQNCGQEEPIREIHFPVPNVGYAIGMQGGVYKYCGNPEADCGLLNAGPRLTAPRPDENLRLFPNPGNGAIRLQAGGAFAGKCLVRIYHANGQEAARFACHAADCSFDVSSLPAGLYFVQLSDPFGRVAVGRLAVQP